MIYRNETYKTKRRKLSSMIYVQDTQCRTLNTSSKLDIVLDLCNQTQKQTTNKLTDQG
jgi:hypothetical protein